MRPTLTGCPNTCCSLAILSIQPRPFFWSLCKVCLKLERGGNRALPRAVSILQDLPCHMLSHWYPHGLVVLQHERMRKTKEELAGGAVACCPETCPSTWTVGNFRATCSLARLPSAHLQLAPWADFEPNANSLLQALSWAGAGEHLLKLTFWLETNPASTPDLRLTILLQLHGPCSLGGNAGSGLHARHSWHCFSPRLPS